MKKQFYITTAIDYTNGAPHLGHAYEKVLTDTIARARRSLGQETFFLTGVDEHGQKVQQAAQAEGKSPKAYCDELAVIWKGLATTLGLTNNDFVRTTDERHKRVVGAILSKLHQQGDLYKDSHTGFYSVREETFLTEKDRNPDGMWDPKWGQVIELKEDNWYFKMGKHQQWLIGYIESTPSFVQPDYRRNEVLGFLKSQPLEDLCITRPASRLSWGIPLPFDPEFVTYVWFDALTNYITVPASLGDPAVCGPLGLATNNHQPSTCLWPADIHVIGKDIVKFHAVYWPIMLHAAGIALPKQILAHGWWQKDGAKMSKTTGNVVEPTAVINEWGLDAFRFYVLRELDIGPDGNWTDAGFKARYQAELANGLGNLVNRSLSMLKRYRDGTVPAPANDLSTDAARAIADVCGQLERNELQAALQSIWALITRANQFVDQTAPFKLAKDPAQAQRLDEVLYNLVETCRIIAVLLWPFLPTTSCRINEQLGLTGAPDQFTGAHWGGLKQGHAIGAPAPLFPRKEP
jgi:methionyl-tRNA synthetase